MISHFPFNEMGNPGYANTNGGSNPNYFIDMIDVIGTNSKTSGWGGGQPQANHPNLISYLNTGRSLKVELNDWQPGDIIGLIVSCDVSGGSAGLWGLGYGGSDYVEIRRSAMVLRTNSKNTQTPLTSPSPFFVDYGLRALLIQVNDLGASIEGKFAMRQFGGTPNGSNTTEWYQGRKFQSQDPTFTNPFLFYDRQSSKYSSDMFIYRGITIEQAMAQTDIFIPDFEARLSAAPLKPVTTPSG
jgi:hypothetical protein